MPRRSCCSCPSAPRPTSSASSTWSACAPSCGAARPRSARTTRSRRSRPTWPTPRPRPTRRCSRRSPTHDDEIAELYLDEHDLKPDQLKAGIRRATLAASLVPVLCGSAFKNKGVQPLLDAVIDYLPSPIDVGAVNGHDAKDESVDDSREASEDEPFAALAFKIASDPHLGKLTYLRALLRPPRGGLLGAQRHQGPQGADRQDLPDARQQACRDRVRRRRPDRGRHGPQGHHHR